MKDDLLLSAPPPLFPDIFGDSPISNFLCVNTSTDVSTVDHSHNTLDGSPSFNNGKDKSFIENPLDSSFSFSRNVEGEHLKFFYHGCHDLCTSSFDHYVHSLLICLGHWSLMIYLLTKSKSPRMSRHFRPS